MNKPTVFAVSVLSAAAFVLNGCGGTAESAIGPTAAPIVLKGAGATAPYLVYQKWIEAFNADFPGMEVEYAATGSGDGLTQLMAGTVAFAGSDMPLSDAELELLGNHPLHFPTVTGAIVPAYNVPGAPQGLKFSSDVLAGIFLGRITRWNDAALLGINPGATLPAEPIVVIHRADSSGSTNAFTEYLTKVSPEWAMGPGQGPSVAWPVGEGAEGSSGLAALVTETPYSIGYVELNYAVRDGLHYGAVRNVEGKFQLPTFVAQNAAVRSRPELAYDLRVSVINASDEDAYPITTVTWLIVPSEIADKDQRAATIRFLRYIYEHGMPMAMDLEYGILPPEVLEKAAAQIDKIR